MHRVTFSFENSLAPHNEIHQFAARLQPTLAEVSRIAAAGSYDSQYASVSLPSDAAMVQRCEQLAKQFVDIEAMVVVGIGGSNLGTMAVHEALHGKLANASRSPRVFFADTVDADSMRAISTLVEAYVTHKRRVLLVLISKSGSTTETIANFEILYNILKTHREQPQRDVVTISDKNSPLWQFAQFYDWECLEIPKQVGGRYSVLSAVGLFPLAVLGVDIHSLVQGAKDARESALSSNFDQNVALHSAAIRAYHAQHGRNVHDLFVFASDLESVGKWWRQLVGESVGKESAEGNPTGVTPTVSVGSTDLHSVGQLYLGGPHDKLTTFVSYSKTDDISVPTMPEFEKLVGHIQGKSLHHIMDAILQGTQTTYDKRGRPFLSIRLPVKNAYVIGQLLQYLMLETIFLGTLLHVNPFDQPHVESYKTEMKEILRRE